MGEMTEDLQRFHELFQQATGIPEGPYPYQERLALAPAEQFPELLDVPTGLGKTAAAVIGWLFRRRFHSHQSVRESTPRRLVYCLPMRVLVEQTRDNAALWIRNLRNAGLLKNDISIYVLMGGEDGSDWDIYPERDMILIGTQDMLLSRALNRGYAVSRSRWPMQFGLLHTDCLWVCDEIQLMGSGLSTTAQLDAFSKKLWLPPKPSRFLWMSATLGASFLRTRDRVDWGISSALPRGLEKEDYEQPQIKKRLHAEKTLQVIKDRPKATEILESHPPGRITLLILNTVSVAKAIYEDIKRELKTDSMNCPRPDVCLLHSRFRAMDRESQIECVLAFLNKMDNSGAVPDSDGLIVVSTQVVEAGFDLSCARLWSEIGPWQSVIQRLGRLNREGRQPEASARFWMPKSDDTNKRDASPNAKRIGPYEKKALAVSFELLEDVIKEQAAGRAYRDALDAVLARADSQKALQIDPEIVIRPDDFFELFSTERDLAGGFTNVSQFVRDQDRDVDVHVFWREFDPRKTKLPIESAPARHELCPVPFFEFRRFIGNTSVAWEWDFETGQWASRRTADIWPGMTLLLPKAAGGYRDDIGWTGDLHHNSFDVLSGSNDEDSLNSDFLRASQEWVPLADHLSDVEAEMRDLLEAVGLQGTPLGNALITAARWHDWGKAVVKWQDAVHDHIAKADAKLEEVADAVGIPRLDEVVKEWRDRLGSKNDVAELWAKFPDIRAVCNDTRLNLSDQERAKLSRKLKVPFRPTLRHEAASALAAWQSWLEGTNGLSALAVYLIACHHGKVRTILRNTRGREDVFGLTDDTLLPPINGFFPNATQLRTEAKYIGACGEWDAAETCFTLSTPSWIQMLAELLGPKRNGGLATLEVIPDNEPHDLGPLALAYLEALLRAADIRASCQPGKGGKR